MFNPQSQPKMPSDIGGDKQTAAELAQMKGQMVAVEQASIAKKCNIQFQGERPPGT
jgi:hypothetical protein